MTYCLIQTIFQSFCCAGKSIFFHLHWSIKGLILGILSGVFFFFSLDNLMHQLKHFESIYHHYFGDLLLLFLTIKENLYMIHFYLFLLIFLGLYSNKPTLSIINSPRFNYFSNSYWYLCGRDSKSSSMISSVSLPIIIYIYYHFL